MMILVFSPMAERGGAVFSKLCALTPSKPTPNSYYVKRVSVSIYTWEFCMSKSLIALALAALTLMPVASFAKPIVVAESEPANTAKPAMKKKAMKKSAMKKDGDAMKKDSAAPADAMKKDDAAMKKDSAAPADAMKKDDAAMKKDSAAPADAVKK
jgi:hypothetical protein